MRRAFWVAVLGSLLSITPLALSQRGGGVGGGHAGGFGGHAAGFGGHSFGGAFSAPRFSGFAPHSFSTAPRMNYGAAGFNYGQPRVASAYAGRYGADYGRWSDNRRGGDRYRSPYRGYGYAGYPYAYANSWELLPWDLGYPDFYDNGFYDNGWGDAQQDTSQQQSAAQLPPDIAADDPPPPPDDVYRPGYQAWAPVPSTPIAPEPKLTLIFNDGHRESIQNYVLTPRKVIVLDQAASGRQQQIPLAELNLAATQEAAQQAGLDFRPPAS